MTTPNPREIGEQHVKKVTAEIKRYLATGTFLDLCPIASATAKFILDNQKETTKAVCKFEADDSNTHPYILLTNTDGRKQSVNLFKIKNNQNIQPKNLGAKSFIAKYFESPELQVQFNEYFDLSYNDC